MEGKRGYYRNKYNKAWEEDDMFKDWIGPDPQDKFVAICRYCHVSLRPNCNDMKKHAETKKHIRNAACKGSHLENPAVVDKKRRELRIATFVACQTSINVIDDLGQILNNELGDNSFRMHHAKCTALIESVLAPYFKRSLSEDANGKPFSLFLHWPTDQTVDTFLCLCIRYYSVESNSIVSTFLGLVDVQTCLADDVAGAIKHFLREMNLDIRLLVGIASDGGNSLSADGHSVFTLLKEAVPRLILIKCSCHTLDVVLKKSLQYLPANLEFMIRETYDWFAQRSDHPEKFRALHNLIYEDLTVDDVDNFCRPYAMSEHFREPLPHLPSSETQTLILADCVDRILTHYHALKCHFSIAAATDNCYKSRLLDEMYADPINRVYLLFINPILAELKRVNSLFQMDQNLFNSNDSSTGSMAAPFTTVHEELNSFFVDLCFRIIKPGVLRVNQQTIHDIDFTNNPSIYLGVVDIDFGTAFVRELKQLELAADEELAVLEKCFQFLKQMVIETSNRFASSSTSILQKLRSVLPTNFRSKTVSLDSLPLKFFDCNRAVLEKEIKCLTKVDWGNWDNPEKFWLDVYCYRDDAGVNPFCHLAGGVLKMLILPVANEEIEHVFSLVNLIKNDVNHVLVLPVLTAILYVRYGLRRINVSCSEFLPPNSLLRSFSSEEFD